MKLIRQFFFYLLLLHYLFFNYKILQITSKPLKKPDSVVDFPLGNERFYCARGEAFLEAYAQLIKAYGIRSNLLNIFPAV